MPNVEIRETTVTPDAFGSVVRLQISDVPLADEHTAAIRMTVEVRLPVYEAPVLLAQWQREAILKAVRDLHPIGEALAQEIRRSPPHGNLSPKPEIPAGS
jgi:hypothetical protein